MFFPQPSSFFLGSLCFRLSLVGLSLGLLGSFAQAQGESLICATACPKKSTAGGSFMNFARASSRPLALTTSSLEADHRTFAGFTVKLSPIPDPSTVNNPDSANSREPYQASDMEPSGTRPFQFHPFFLNTTEPAIQLAVPSTSVFKAQPAAPTTLQSTAELAAENQLGRVPASPSWYAENNTQGFKEPPDFYEERYARKLDVKDQTCNAQVTSACKDSFRLESEEARFLWYKAKNYYSLKAWQQAEFLLITLANDHPLGAEPKKTSQLLLVATLLQKQQYTQAEQVFQSLPKEDQSDARLFNAEPKAALYSPLRAKVFSAVLPASGFLYLGEGKKFLLSFGIQSLLLHFMLRAYREKSYALAFSLLFFEAPFYLGAIAASEELAQQKNDQLLKARYQAWLERLESNLF